MSSAHLPPFYRGAGHVLYDVLTKKMGIKDSIYNSKLPHGCDVRRVYPLVSKILSIWEGVKSQLESSLLVLGEKDEFCLLAVAFDSISRTNNPPKIKGADVKLKVKKIIEVLKENGAGTETTKTLENKDLKHQLPRYIRLRKHLLTQKNMRTLEELSGVLDHDFPNDCMVFDPTLSLQLSQCDLVKTGKVILQDKSSMLNGFAHENSSIPSNGENEI